MTELDLKEDRKKLELQLYVVIGLYGTSAITKAWSSEPDYWDREVAAVGSGLDDLGIPDIPTEPGWYRWYGTMKTYGPDRDGDYDGVYKGEWVLMTKLAQR